MELLSRSTCQLRHQTLLLCIRILTLLIGDQWAVQSLFKWERMYQSLLLTRILEIQKTLKQVRLIILRFCTKIVQTLSSTSSETPSSRRLSPTVDSLPVAPPLTSLEDGLTRKPNMVCSHSAESEIISPEQSSFKPQEFNVTHQLLHQELTRHCLLKFHRTVWTLWILDLLSVIMKNQFLMI